jgi:hypothetical protein
VIEFGRNIMRAKIDHHRAAHRERVQEYSRGRCGRVPLVNRAPVEERRIKLRWGKVSRAAGTAGSGRVLVTWKKEYWRRIWKSDGVFSKSV